MTEVFGNTIGQLAILFGFIIAGIIIGRLRILPEDAAGTLSKLLTIFFMPALTFRSCATNCKMENIMQYITYISISAAVIIVLFFISKLLACRFAKNDSEIGIYSYALTVSNCGYMGYPMMLAMFGDLMLFKMMIVGIPVNIYIYTLGMGMMATGKISLRSLINPVFIATMLGIVFGLSGLTLPSIADEFLSGAANCMSPVAMLVSGLVMSRLPFKKLFGDVRAYIVALLRLIILPAVLVAVLYLLGVGEELLVIMLVLNAMPIGMNTIVFPEAHGIDGTSGAKLVLVSNILCIITIPLMVMIFLQLFPGIAG